MYVSDVYNMKINENSTIVGIGGCIGGIFVDNGTKFQKK